MTISISTENARVIPFWSPLIRNDCRPLARLNDITLNPGVCGVNMTISAISKARIAVVVPRQMYRGLFLMGIQPYMHFLVDAMFFPLDDLLPGSLLFECELLLPLCWYPVFFLYLSCISRTFAFCGRCTCSDAAFPL